MNSYLKYAIIGIGLLILQFIFQNNFILYNTGFCFVYIALILILPYETPPMLLIAIGFVLGISVDIFSDTLGINAASTVLVAFLRPYILGFMTPKGGYGQNFAFSIKETGITWYVTYAITLITIHHLALFIIDASSISLFGLALLKTVASTFLTLIVVIFGQLILTRSKTK